MSAIGTTIPPFVASPERLEALRRRRACRLMARSLFHGKWKKVLVDSNRTQHLFGQVLASTSQGTTESRQVFVGVGLVKKAMKAHADILTARPVLLFTDEGFEVQEAAVRAIRDRVLFDTMYHEAALRCFTESEAALRADMTPQGAVVRLASNDDTFPVGEPGDDGQPEVWERRWIIERPDPADPRKRIMFLRIERHRAPGGVGVVEHEAYATESSDVLQPTAGLSPMPLQRAIGADAPAPAPIRLTGLPHPLITQLVAYRMDGEPQATIDDADLGLVDAMVAGMSRLARSMEAHGEPKLRVPEGMLKDGKLVGKWDVFVDPDRLVEYIQAHFEFQAMSEFFNSVMQWLIVSLDMAASLLGYKPQGGAAPDSFDKLRLESTLTLANARRVALLHGPALGRAFTLASALESRLLDGWPVGQVRATVRADLPKDTLEIGREQRELLEAGLTSRRRAIAAVHGDEHVDEVLAEIDQDQSAATARAQASLFGSAFGDPPAGDPQPGDPAPGNSQPEGAAA